MRRFGPVSISGAVVLSIVILLASSGFLLARASDGGSGTVGLLAIDMDNTGNSIGTAIDNDAGTEHDLSNNCDQIVKPVVIDLP